MYPLPTHAGSSSAAIHASPTSYGYIPVDGSLDNPEDSDSADEQSGGVQLSSSPGSGDAGIAEGMQGVTAYAFTYYPGHGSVLSFPATLYPPFTFHPSPVAGAGHMAEAQSVSQTIPYFQNLSVYPAAGTQALAPGQTDPPYQMLTNPVSNAITGNATTPPQPYAFTFDNLTPGEDDPFVVDNDHGWPVHRFLSRWRELGGFDQSIDTVGAEASRVQGWERPSTVTSDELQGDRYDIQGIDWTRLETTRTKARRARRKLYQKMAGEIDRRIPPWAKRLPDTENYFRFRKMNTEHRAWIAHFQLRNMISATSRSDIYYAGKSKIMHTDSSRRTADCVMDLSKVSMDSAAFMVTTMTASDNALVAGGYYGDYAYTNLASETGMGPITGFITEAHNGITNHVQVSKARSTTNPQAAFSSNDSHLRILDLHSNRFVNSIRYPEPINCTAISPNSRLRAVVGDFAGALITDASSGQALQQLHGHAGDAFACAWADDDITLATAAQDCQILVWDARNWARPLACLATELACARSLRFSPVGGGRRVLLAAEADDVVSVIDAEAFDRRQVLDCFGTVAGVAVAPDGDEFWVANADPTFGGLMEFERVGYGERFGVGVSRRVRRGAWGFGPSLEREGPPEWVGEGELEGDVRVRRTARARRRRGLGLGVLVL